MPVLSETTKPGAVWLALRRAPVQVEGTSQGTSPFGLRLTIGVTAGERVAPAKVVKPLVDGLIAGLHDHDGTALAEVSNRLQSQLPNATAEEVATLLGSAQPAPLGRRRLLWPRAAGVQWNPADDRCLALELRVEPSDIRELSGQLVELTER
jgi:hypothetical protein